MVIIKGETPEEAAKRKAAEAAKKLLDEQGSGGGSGSSKSSVVNWTTNNAGDVVTKTKNITDAKNYMNPTATEYPWLVETFNTVKSAGKTTARNPLTWWKQVVDQAAASGGLTPFAIAIAYQGDLPSVTGELEDGLTKAERAKLAEMKNVIKALNQNPESDLSGDAGKIQDTLTKYVDYMGLMKGRKEINSYVKSIMEQSTNADAVADNLRKQAAVLYPNFSERLNANPELTVRDLVNPYLQVMAGTLEIDPQLVKMTDPTIQNAINGSKLRSLTDFRNDMRADSRFATTKTAKREAVDFAQSLLKGFGYNV
jgi:hypothetical protein